MRSIHGNVSTLAREKSLRAKLAPLRLRCRYAPDVCETNEVLTPSELREPVPISAKNQNENYRQHDFVEKTKQLLGVRWGLDDD